MRTWISRLLIVFCLLLQFSFWGQSQNLIQNNSCDDPLVGGNIPFWQDVNGTGWTQRTSSPSPYNGNAYFFANVGADAKLIQDIDIESYKCAIDLGIQKFHFTGFVRSYDQNPSDESNIFIEFFNGTNSLLSSFHFGPYNQTSIWKAIDSLLLAPPGSRKVKISLNSIRHNGANNDGYYDELALVPTNVTSGPFQIHIDTSICKGQTYLGYSQSGLYIDTLSEPNGCIVIRTLNLTVISIGSSTTDVTVCKSQLPYVWNSQVLVASGQYTAMFPTPSGCDSNAVLNLTVADKPKPDLGEDRTLCRGDQLTLSPGVFSNYLWQDFSILNHYTVTQTGLYSVQVLNLCGSSTDQIIITVKDCNISFPNSFSPNGDGKNEVFKVLDYTSNYFNLTIFNRYGQKVFETSDYAKGWDGTFTGKLQSAGTYVYYCKYMKSNVPMELQGTVILLR